MAAHTAVALDRLSLAVAARVIEPLRQVGLLGEIELVEFRDATAQPDLAGRRIHKVYGNKPAWLSPVLRFDHKMGDGKSHRVHNQTAHLAANAIRGTRLGPDRELRRLCHGCRLLAQSSALYAQRRRAVPQMNHPGWVKGRRYRWLNPLDSSFDMGTVTGCLEKWATAAWKSSRSREAMS